MLIRSQDKEMIVNVDVTNHIFIGGTYRSNGSRYDVFADETGLGYYSTKEKALKVLDMIQEAYGDSEYTKYVIPEVCKSLSMKPRTEESIAHAGEIGEMLKKGMTFQMPADIEVEV